MARGGYRPVWTLRSWLPRSLARWRRAGVSRVRPVKHQRWLVTLLVFPAVGVIHDQVGQREGPVVSMVVTRPLMVWVSGVKGFMVESHHE